MKNNLSDILIISNYDMGYSCTALLEGSIHRASSEIVKNYCRMNIKDFLKWSFAVFKKDVLICEDGCIEFYPFELSGQKETWHEVPKYITCKDCKHLMFSDFYGECSRGYRGIVNPNDTCEHAERKYR